MRATLIRIVPACLVVALTAYDYAQPAPVADDIVQPAQVTDGVRSITIPVVAPPEMPDGPNKELFAINCVLCHTTRYVTMQPVFSRKVWTAEVEKMKKVYGAPIEDATMPKLVEYLMSIRGAEPVSTVPAAK